MTDNSELNKQLALLIARCAKSDEDALCELYHLSSAKLLALQVRILGMNPMAERALHDTYARIWLKSPTYGEQLGKPMTWMTSIARNHALNLRRAYRDSKNSDEHLDETAELSAELADISFLESNPNARSLLSSLQKLDDKTRVSIVTAYLDGLSLEDLSAVYNTPTDSVQNAIHEGLLSIGGAHASV